MEPKEQGNITEDEMFEFIDKLMDLLPMGTSIQALNPDPYHPSEILIQLRYGNQIELYAIDITTRTFVRVYL